jgi:hypothetical protein
MTYIWDVRWQVVWIILNRRKRGRRNNQMKSKYDLLEMIRLMPDDIEVFSTKAGVYNEINVIIFLKPKDEEFYEWYFGI